MSRRVTVLAPLLAATALVAGGCAADEAADQSVEKSLEKSIEDATSDDVDVDLGDGSVKVESSDGTFEAGTGNLPEGFPVDDVPVVDGKILVGVSDGAGGFSVTVQYDGSADDAFAAAEMALTDAGMSSSDELDTLEGSNTGVFEGNGYEALVAVVDSGGEPAVSYVVTRR
jgi:hypothetical protein